MAVTGKYPQMNRFEQVSSGDHQISVAGRGREGGGFPRSHVRGLGRGRSGGFPRSQVQGWISKVPYPGGIPYHVTCPMMHVMLL